MAINVSLETTAATKYDPAVAFYKVSGDSSGFSGVTVETHPNGIATVMINFENTNEQKKACSKARELLQHGKFSEVETKQFGGSSSAYLKITNIPEAEVARMLICLAQEADLGKGQILFPAINKASAEAIINQECARLNKTPQDLGLITITTANMTPDWEKMSAKKLIYVDADLGKYPFSPVDFMREDGQSFGGSRFTNQVVVQTQLFCKTEHEAQEIAKLLKAQGIGIEGTIAKTGKVVTATAGADIVAAVLTDKGMLSQAISKSIIDSVIQVRGEPTPPTPKVPLPQAKKPAAPRA